MHLPAAASVADIKLFTSLGQQSVDGRLASAKVIPSLVIVSGYQQTVHKPLMVNRHQWKWCWQSPSCLLLSTECSPALREQVSTKIRQTANRSAQTCMWLYWSSCCLLEWEVMLETKTKKLMKKPHRQSEASEKREMTDRVSEGNRA